MEDRDRAMKELLRDYQQEMKDRLYEAWTRCQSVMVQMPTGTGKTYLMAEVIREHMERGVMIVAHRIELTGQISKMLDRFGVPHGVIDRWTKDVEEVTSRHKVIVASIQTLARRIGHTENRCQMEEGRGKMLLCHTDITDNTEIRWMMEEKKPGR